jgi:hypothetical protein
MDSIVGCSGFVRLRITDTGGNGNDEKERDICDFQDAP